MVESIATWDTDVFCPGPTNGVETSVCSTTRQIIEKLQWHLQVNKFYGNLIAFSMHHLDGQIRESDRKLVAGIIGGRKVYFPAPILEALACQAQFGRYAHREEHL